MNLRSAALTILAVLGVGIGVLAETPESAEAVSPTISSISPNTAEFGSAAVVTVFGSEFEAGIVVNVHVAPTGLTIVPTLVSSTELNFVLDNSIPPGSYSLRVRNVGFAPSTGLPFTVTSPPSSGPPVQFVEVNSGSDPGDGSCTLAECTLREAIAAANAHPNTTGPDLISFNIGNGGLRTITTNGQLPPITEAVYLDGLSQPGAACGAALIEIQGNAGSGNGIQVAAAGSTVRGLAIGGFSNGAGVRVTAGSTLVECNAIGTDASGTVPRPNGTGVSLSSSANAIRANVIAFNATYGIVGGSNAISGNSIHDNGSLGIAGQAASQYGNFSRALAPNVGGMVDFRLNTGSGFAATGTPFTFEIFASTSCDASGFGEGAMSLGTFSSTIGSSDGGRAIVTGLVGPVLENSVLTATLTNDATGVTGPFGPCAVPGLRITSVLPAAEFEPDGTVPVYVEGEGFIPGMRLTVFLNDPALAGLNPLPPVDLTYVSATRATALLTSEMQGFVTVAAVRAQDDGGGASAAFSFHIWPRLVEMTPIASAAGSGDAQITVTGNRFVVGGPGALPSIVRVNGTELSAANVDVQSPTRIVATIPGAMLTAIGTLQITVVNPLSLPPAPSNTLPFFVTEAAAPVLDADAATAVVPEEVTVTASTATGESIAAATNGTGTVAVANYGAAPAEIGTLFQSVNRYFDVFIAPGSDFPSTTITYCMPGEADTLFWSPTGEGGFIEVPGVASAPSGPGESCLQFTVTATSSPSIADLGGTAFAAARSNACVATPTIVGTNGNDTIHGTPGDDVIHAGPGNDKVYGNGGNDLICSGPGNDTIETGDGDDGIDAGDGNDTIRAGEGTNFVSAGAGNDRVTTGDGDDTIRTAEGNDTVRAGDGVNVIDSGAGNDNVTTGSGPDSIETGDGNDSISAGSGDDSVSSGAGNDDVDGGPGVDTCLPGPGNDSVTACET